MFVSQGLVLLFQLVYFELGLLLLQNDSIQILFSFINELFHRLHLFVIVGDFRLISLQHFDSVLKVGFRFLYLSFQASIRLFQRLCLSFVNHQLVEALSLAFGGILKLNF